MIKISVQAAAKKYGCTENRLYKAMDRGALRTYRELGRVYLDDEEVSTHFLPPDFQPSKADDNG